MKIAIRIDDITESMDWPKFYRFKELLDLHNVKPLIGVIPMNMDESIDGDSSGAPDDFWAYVKELSNDGYLIAMHGVNHIYTTNKSGLFPLNRFSEFAGLPYDEQLELLSYGVDIFNEHSIETDIFMAPGHTFDKATLKALGSLGFSKITDGFGNNPYEYKNFTFYPISKNRSSVLKAKDKEGYTTFVYHINTMNEKDFDSFKQLLEENEVISYEKYLTANVVKRSSFSLAIDYCLAKLKNIIVSLIK